MTGYIPRVTWTLIAVGREWAVSRSCRGKEEFVGSDSFWSRNPGTIGASFATESKAILFIEAERMREEAR